ncbi:MAG: FAD-dependent oxidoreductase, partial [Anaerolineae bacterium]|nr:FAD-dependent oxidoreductase [Anaerolineae bacterium]
TGSPQFHHWGLDPLAEGCYTAPDNRAYETLPLLSQPVGRITLAGEHLSGSGTMNGALESGLAAAKRVRRLLG